MTADPNRSLLLDHDLTKPPGQRPDIVDLIGPWFDRPRGEPAGKTLIICAAPRTGSTNRRPPLRVGERRDLGAT